MKLIKEEITGGKVSEGLFGGAFAFDLCTEGATSAKVLEKTYEAELSIPYTLTIKQETEPAKDKKGKARELKEQPEYDVEISFPFEYNGMKGTIEMNYIPGLYNAKQEDIPELIRKTIGHNLAQLKHVAKQD